MKNDYENTQAGNRCQERLILPLWPEYGDGPPKSGGYDIKVRSKDGREKTITAWHNSGNGHWLADGKECGYVDIITPPGETEEWRITHWHNVKVSDRNLLVVLDQIREIIPLHEMEIRRSLDLHYSANLYRAPEMQDWHSVAATLQLHCEGRTEPWIEESLAVWRDDVNAELTHSETKP